MGEGTMRAETGFIKGAYTFASMAIMAPMAAIFMKFLNLSIFQPSDPRFYQDIKMIAAFALVIAGVNILLLVAGSKVFNRESPNNYYIQLAGFLIGGALSGAILAFAVFELEPSKILQGAIGGVIAAALIGFMVPRSLSKRMTATLSGPEM